MSTSTSTISTITNRLPGAASVPPGASRDHSNSSKPAAAVGAPPSISPSDPNVSDVPAYESFDSMGLDDKLLRGIYGHGFEKPSEIQKRGIKALITGRDLIAQAQSGTGKTGCFAIGGLQKVDPAVPETQTIILANTRELANQTAKIVASIGTCLEGVSSHAFIGGTSVRHDLDILRDGKAQIAIGTPGRVLHLINEAARSGGSRGMTTNKVGLLVLDEADEMLDGFQDELYNILQHLPANAQIGLFSATLPPAALELASKFMRNPLKLLVKQDMLTLDGINQYYVNCEREDWKLDTLCDLYEVISTAQTMIFVNNRRKADWLHDVLDERGHTVSLIHGELDQHERETRMMEFRTGSSRILLATDVLGRGIDVYSVSLVVNFDLPRVPEPYLHRIGRSGRYGRKGTAINLVTDQDAQSLRAIEQHFATEIKELPANIADLV